MIKCFKYVIIIICIISLNCNKKVQVRPIQKIKIMMDTFVKITIYDESKSTTDILKIIDEAFYEINKIDSIANNRSEKSLITQINNNAGINEIKLNSELFEIINQAQEVSKLTEGAFDITIFPLLKLWKFADSINHIPTNDEIQKTLNAVDYEHIMINADQISFKQSNVKLDLGGIAKGYAVDKGMEVLIKHGITDALINAGGDFRAICSNLTTGKRKVWIKHPRKSSEFYGYFKMNTGSVATSGDCERFFIVDSVRYHHILNPKTGNPGRKSVSVTIQTADAILADALATAIFNLGPQKGIELINNLENVEGLIIFKDKGSLQHSISKGLKNNFIKI